MPAPAGRADVDDVREIPSYRELILTGSLSATTFTVLPSVVPSETFSVPPSAGAVVTLTVSIAALAVDVGRDGSGRAVDVDRVVAVGAEVVLGVQGQRADVATVGEATESGRLTVVEVTISTAERISRLDFRA